jgi:hypothetical protein
VVIEFARQKNFHFLKGKQGEENGDPVPHDADRGSPPGLRTPGKRQVRRNYGHGYEERLKVEVRTIRKKGRQTRYVDKVADQDPIRPSE